MSGFYDFSALLLDGTLVKMATYTGKVVLVVNVASKCGFTPQYKGLEALWRRYRGAGLVVLGFPCNQFGGEEPGSAAEIAQFCSTTYDVSFPIFSKIKVNGSGADPIYRFLKANAPETGDIEWNFTKFLIGRDGKVVARFASNVEPDSLAGEVERLL